MSLFYVPEEWIETTLGEIIELKYGKSLPADKRDGEGFPVYGSNGVVGKHLEPLVAHAGIVVGRKGSYGEVHFSKNPFFPIDTTYFVDCFFEQPLRYWFYQLKLLPLTSLNRSTAIPGLNREDAYEQIIFLPPLADQQQIAQKLDELLAQVDTLKTRLDAIPKILKRFRQSVLAAAVSGRLTEGWRADREQEKITLPEAFSLDSKYIFSVPSCWHLTAIGNTTSFQQGLQIAKDTRRTATDENVLPILRTVNYENNFTEDVHYALVDEKSIIAEPDDIILSRTGTVGRVLTGFKGIMHNNSFRLNYNKNYLLRVYLIFFLRSPLCQEYVKENSGRSTQPDLTHKAFAKCPISIPRLEEQTEIVRRVEQLFAYADQIEQRVKDAQARVNHLTQSILAKAFRGELTADWRAQNPELISGENAAAALLGRIRVEREAAKPKRK